MGELGSRCTTERVQIGNSPPKDARAAILPGLNSCINLLLPWAWANYVCFLGLRPGAIDS